MCTCVEAISPGACEALMAAARLRAPVKSTGVGGASLMAGSAAAAAAAACISRCWLCRSAEQKVKSAGSIPFFLSWAERRMAQRKGYCAVCERESTTTGTPISRLRQT